MSALHEQVIAAQAVSGYPRPDAVRRTDVCPEWAQGAIRHLARNVEIECPVHAQCGEFERGEGSFVAVAVNAAPVLARQAQAALALHERYVGNFGELHVDLCAYCEETWPCRTVRALTEVPS